MCYRHLPELHGITWTGFSLHESQKCAHCEKSEMSAAAAYPCSSCSALFRPLLTIEMTDSVATTDCDSKISQLLPRAKVSVIRWGLHHVCINFTTGIIQNLPNLMYLCHHAPRKHGNAIVTEMLIRDLKISFDLCSIKLAKDQTLRTAVACVATEKLGDPPTLRRAQSDRHGLLHRCLSIAYYVLDISGK